MPRIPDYHLDSTFYLYPDTKSAEDGVGLGGTGFFCGLPATPELEKIPNRWQMMTMVTNKHVIEAGHWTVRANKKGGGVVIYDTTDREWSFSKDYDIAVSTSGGAMAMGAQCSSINPTSLATLDKVKLYDFGIGDDIFMIGRFINWDGIQTNKPVARFGNIAQFPNPSEPGGKILIEVRSIGGFSGSPVFLHAHSETTTEPDKLKRPRNTILPPLLLGINSAHSARKSTILDANGMPNRAGFYIAANTGFAIVEPAWALHDLFTSLDAYKNQNAAHKGQVKNVEKPKMSDIDNAPKQEPEALSATLSEPGSPKALSESDEVLKKLLNTPPKPR